MDLNCWQQYVLLLNLRSPQLAEPEAHGLGNLMYTGMPEQTADLQAMPIFW